MTEAGPKGSRRGRRRGGGARPANGKAEGAANGARKRKRRRRLRADGSGKNGRDQLDRMPPQTAVDGSILGGRMLKTAPAQEVVTEEGPPDAFMLFCAYYLGVTPDDGYQKPNAEELAKRHGMSAEELNKLLVEYEIDPTRVEGSEFDLHGAQLDIRLAPKGISRLETARGFYEEYLAVVGAN